MLGEKEVFVFPFEGQILRMLLLDGQLWFYVIDVFCILRLSNPFERLKELAKGDVEYTSFEDGHTCVTQRGLFALAFKSGSPLAIELCNWVTSEAMDSIRKGVAKNQSSHLYLVPPISAHATGNSLAQA